MRKVKKYKEIEKYIKQLPLSENGFVKLDKYILSKFSKNELIQLVLTMQQDCEELVESSNKNSIEIQKIVTELEKQIKGDNI